MLKWLNLQIRKNEFIGIIGLFGAGKSTLLRSLISSIDLFSGSYKVFGYRLNRISKGDLKTSQ